MKELVFNIVTSYENGVATCSFTRTLTMPSVTNYFDLNKSYYILAANGPIFSGSISTHSFYKSSSTMYSFKNGQTTGQYTTSSLSSSTASSTPSNSPQNYSVSTIKISWKDNGDSTDIVMTNSIANNNSRYK